MSTLQVTLKQLDILTRLVQQVGRHNFVGQDGEDIYVVLTTESGLRYEGLIKAVMSNSGLRLIPTGHFDAPGAADMRWMMDLGDCYIQLESEVKRAHGVVETKSVRIPLSALDELRFLSSTGRYKVESSVEGAKAVAS